MPIYHPLSLSALLLPLLTLIVLTVTLSPPCAAASSDSLTSVALANSALLSHPVPTCPTGQFWNSVLLKCDGCAANQVVGVGGRCVCASGYYREQTNGTGILPDQTCVACPAGQYASADETFCRTCIQPSDPSLSGTQCTCGVGEYLVDRDAATALPLASATCTPCPIYAYPTRNLTTCIECPQHVMQAVYAADSGTYECVCRGDLGFSETPQDGTCIALASTSAIQSRVPASSIYTVTYRDILTPSGTSTTLTARSDIFASTLIGAAAGCEFDWDTESCQLLANLCVLQLYDSSASACALYARVAQAKAQGAGEGDELRGLPRIYYGLGTTLEDSTTVTSQVVTLPAGSDTLNLLLGAYTLNGTFLGYEPVGAQLQYCLQTPIDQTTAWLKIGHNFEGSCRVNLTSLLQGRAGVVFYQLYIRDATSTLLPIPIRLTNYRATGARQPNLDPDPLSYGSSTLFRRFFVTDGVSGVEGGVRRAVRGVQGVRVWIRKAPGARSVYIPVVDLTYFERDVSTLSGADGGSDVSFPQVTFEMHYTAPLDSFWKAVKIVFALVCVYAGFLALYRARAWSARNLGAGEGWDVQFFGRCIIILAGSLAPPVIFLLLGISAYWFFAFKNTANALDHLLPWSSGDLSTFSAVGVVALCCYALYILKELHAQCTADIFFIDWEQSKGRILRSGDEGKARLAPVSVWRSIFLMNVWDDIQTHRLVNIELNLLAMFFILDTLQVRYAATPQPDRQDLTPGPTSPILLFGVEGMVWLALSAAQALFRHLVHDRFYRNRLLNFIDVLSMANLSVFAFDEQCHGYYIHGKSVHQCADTSVAELNGFLRKEQADLVPRRGLQGSDQQCFEVLAQKEFRAAFNKVYRAVIADLDRGDGAAARAQRLTMEPRARRFTGADEERVRAYETVNHFLKSFFDQNLKDYPYVIRTRTYFERFLAKTPDVSHTSVLFHDTTATPFTPLLLRGLEPHLLLLYALLFTLVSQAVDSTGVAVVVVYGVDVAVRCGRRHFGRGNVGRKGLMDGKFLV